MKIKHIPFVIFPIFFTITGELFLKASINSLGFHVALSNIHVVVTQPRVLIGVCFIITAGVLWLVAMSRFELSFLYPFLSMDYLAIILGSQLILGETVTPQRYMSAFLIMTGLLFISRSRHSEHKKTDQDRSLSC